MCSGAKLIWRAGARLFAVAQDAHEGVVHGEHAGSAFRATAGGWWSWWRLHGHGVRAGSAPTAVIVTGSVAGRAAGRPVPGTGPR